MSRLLLARPADHPLVEVVRQAGWIPVPCFTTRTVSLNDPPPIPLGHAAAVVILSPAGARAVAAHLLPGMRILATGPGTAEPLLGRGLDLRQPEEPRGESLWELLQSCVPGGGDIVAVRAERGRDFLARVCEGSPWRLHPWITHREVPADPLPDLPQAEALLALGPLQAELLGPRAGERLRLAWGVRTAAAFAACGYPAHDSCDPTPASLALMLARSSPGG